MNRIHDVIDWVVTLIPPGDGLLVRPRWVDILLSLVLAVGTLVEFPFITTPFPRGVGVGGLVMAVLVVWRRVFPLAVVVLVTAVAVSIDVVAAITDEPVIGTFAGGLSVLTILYSLGRWAPRSTILRSAAIAALLLPSTGFLNPVNDPPWASFLIEVTLTAAVIGTGVLVRSRDLLKTEKARAELAEERNHLANDIHDSVAHHMSAIAIRAEGARQLTDPGLRDEAFDAIARSASAGLTDVRQLLSNIRATEDMPTPLPGLGDLKQLAEQATTPSLDVEVVIDVATETIPVTVAAVAYSIAREALTNVRRHATGATRASVRARTTDQFLDLTITDNGATPTGPPDGPGFGIRVMTERANSVGGNLSAGPDPTGGWLVASRLPLSEGRP